MCLIHSLWPGQEEAGADTFKQFVHLQCAFVTISLVHKEVQGGFLYAFNEWWPVE